MNEVRIEISDASLGLPVDEKHEYDDTAILVDRLAKDVRSVEAGERTIVFDMSAVPSRISHSVVALMMEVIAKAKQAGNTVQAVIDSATPEVMEKLRIMHLDVLFTINPRNADDGTINA